jgi:hypothetical protein
MKSVRRETEELVTQQKAEIYDWPVEVWRRLFSLLREQRAAKDFPDVLEAVDVRIPFDLRMVIVHKSIRHGIRVKQETQQQKSAKQPASLLWGNRLRHGHRRAPFCLFHAPR